MLHTIQNNFLCSHKILYDNYFYIILINPLSFIGILLKGTILSWIDVPYKLRADAGTYISIYVIGITAIFIYDISRAIIVAMGDSKCSMILLMITSFINIILEFLFINVFHMGVGGAAFATILSQFIGMLLTLLILRNKLQPFMKGHCSASVQLGKIKEILSIAIPSMVQQLILSLSSLFLQTLVNPYGSQIISGYMAVNKITLFGMLVVIGMSQALSIFISSNSGANQINRIKKGYQFCMIFSTAYLLFIIALNFLIPQYLIGAFINIHDNLKAYQFSNVYLQFSCVMYLFYGWKIVSENLLRGFLMMKQFLYSNFTDLAAKIIATYILVSKLSLDGFWIGNTVGKIISVIICIFTILHNHLLYQSALYANNTKQT